MGLAVANIRVYLTNWSFLPNNVHVMDAPPAVCHCKWEHRGRGEKGRGGEGRGTLVYVAIVDSWLIYNGMYYKSVMDLISHSCLTMCM